MSSDQTELALKHAIAHAKTSLDKTFYQGVMLLLQEAYEQAWTCFEDVLKQDKAHTDARCNLGVIALKKNQAQLAITYFSETLGYDEKHEFARNNLAATFIHHARFENALTHYNVLIQDNPENLEYLYNAGVAEMSLGHLEKAKTLFSKVLKLNPNHSASLTNLANIASRLNQPMDAMKYLERAHEANPSDSSNRFMLDALKGQPRDTGSLDYAKNLFDNYALFYEKHMVETLNYKTPQHIATMLHQHLNHLGQETTLDLGCGTGLSGVVLRELSTKLIGVDLSERMLEEAERKGIYDELVQQDIEAYLKNSDDTFSLIVAADVLPYFGDLERFFELAAKKLKESGLLLVTHEISTKNPFCLQSTARFAHHPDYLHTTSSQQGFITRDKGEYIARKHHDKDLPVMLHVFQKTT